MNSETKPDIYQVELNRVKGTNSSLRKALDDSRAEGIVPIRSLPALSQAELANKMRFWRIHVVTLGSLFNAQWNGREAAKLLTESRDMIQTYYYDPYSWGIAKDLRQDAEGHEYQMAAEMCRDEAKYYEKASQLTGSRRLLVSAAEAYSEAIDLSTPNSSVQSLARMERQRLDQAMEGPFDVDRFTSSYRRVVDVAVEEGNWDRMAAASWMYIKGLSRARVITGMVEGKGNLVLATHQLGKDWREYQQRDLIGNVLGGARRLTAIGLDSNQFLLP